MRAVGKNSQELITELGIIVRQMAPLQFPKWKAIPIDDRKKMWHAIKVSHLNYEAKFSLDYFTYFSCQIYFCLFSYIIFPAQVYSPR